MIIDLLYVLQWWLVLFIIGIIALPLTSLIFSSFFDKGYALSKILGILLISYFVWLIGSLHLFPFTNITILLGLFTLSLVNLTILIKKQLLWKLKQSSKWFLLEELLFLGGLIFWSYVRSFEPSIHGLEKYMDFGFINSILRSDYFPPKDLWLTPYTINYYYFGHFVTALLTKLSNIPSLITYNLMVATIFTLTFSTSFSIASNLFSIFSSSKPNTIRYTLIAGFLGAFLVTLAGNLHTIYVFFQSYLPDSPVPFWQLPSSLNYGGYWYPNATRFIPFTIHEFPLYSFVVSDLHGHVFNIPFVLLLIALLIVIFLKPIQHYIFYALISLLLAIFLMTNVLDGPIYLLLIFLLLIVKNRFGKWTETLASLLIIGLGAILFSLPFWLTFQPFGSAIGVMCAPSFLTNLGHLGPFLFEPNHCARSPIWMLLILWGFFYSAVIIFILTFRKSLRQFIQKMSVDYLVIFLALFALLLIIIPEFVYVKDIYPVHYRANTVFKFGYQAFIILGLISSYMMVRIYTGISNKKVLILSSLLIIPTLFLVSIYPYFAINSYYGSLINYQGLDGLKYLSNSYPTDYQAILWINQNIKGQPIILEAQGDSYTDYARISSNTGLPTVIGWPVHEWLWRGSYDEPGKRITEITNLYESTDLNLTKSLLEKYHVSYVFIGDLERQKYLKIDENKFSLLGKIIYQNGNTKIYQIY